MTTKKLAVPRIACIGAICLDKKAFSHGSVVLGSSNPVTLRRGAGGVARNVAENLARLGCAVHIASRIGGDGDGDRLLDGCRDLGIDVSLTDVSDTADTATYTALLAPDGELVIALADMAVFDEITIAAAARWPAQLARCDLWFLDANLPAETMRYLLSERPSSRTLVAVDCVSVAKSARLRQCLPHIDLLFANRDELSALSGLPVRAPLDVLTAAAILRRAGVGSIFVSLGTAGCFVSTDAIEAFCPALPARVQDVTGAGDATIAGYLYATLLGYGACAAQTVAMAAAAFAVESVDTVNPDLDPQRLFDKAAVDRSAA